MFDIVVRYCGPGEWLPIIEVVTSCLHFRLGQELYRGERLPSAFAAWEKAMEIWNSNGTGNVAEFKRVRGLGD